MARDDVSKCVDVVDGSGHESLAIPVCSRLGH